METTNANIIKWIKRAYDLFGNAAFFKGQFPLETFSMDEDNSGIALYSRIIQADRRNTDVDSFRMAIKIRDNSDAKPDAVYTEVDIYKYISYDKSDCTMREDSIIYHKHMEYCGESLLNLIANDLYDNYMEVYNFYPLASIDTRYNGWLNYINSIMTTFSHFNMNLQLIFVNNKRNIFRFSCVVENVTIVLEVTNSALHIYYSIGGDIDKYFMWKGHRAIEYDFSKDIDCNYQKFFDTIQYIKKKYKGD